MMHLSSCCFRGLHEMLRRASCGVWVTQPFDHLRLNRSEAVSVYMKSPNFPCGKVKPSATTFVRSFPFADSYIFPSPPSKISDRANVKYRMTEKRHADFGIQGHFIW
jgi:hypothetical protein